MSRTDAITNYSGYKAKLSNTHEFVPTKLLECNNSAPNAEDNPILEGIVPTNNAITFDNIIAQLILKNKQTLA